MTIASLIPLALALQVSATAPARDVGSVGGRVLAANDASPVAGAVVTIDSLHLSARSGSDGRYDLLGVPEGRWALEVGAEGYLGRRIVVRVPAEGSVVLDFELAALPRTEAVGRIVGTVREQGRLEPIRFATVDVVGLPIAGVADDGGLFALPRVPAGERTLRAIAPGYREARLGVSLEAGAVARVTLTLVPDPVVLPGVLVAGTRSVGTLSIESPAALVLDSAYFDLVPTVFERDVLRALQSVPSLTPSSDYSSAPFVRGGTPDQTLILLDGAPIYNPYHLGGFTSAFAPSAVAATVLRPGGLPASAPSALSGILEVQARDGGRDSVRVSGSLGLLSSHATVDGPLRGGRGAYLLSARRTYVDVATDFASTLGLMDDGLPYGFYDLHGKLTHDLGRAASVSVTGYLNRESIDVGGRDGTGTWGNDLVSARIAGFLGHGLRGELGAGTSAFGISYSRFHAVGPDDVRQGTKLEPHLRTRFVDGQLSRTFGAHTLWAGGRWERSDYSHLLAPDGGDADWIPTLNIEGHYGPFAFYLRDQWRVVEPLILDAGIRVEKLSGQAWQMLPRGRVSWDLGSGSLAIAAGRYVQDRWSLRNEEGVVASVVGYDLPLGTPNGRPLQEGWDVVLEGRWSLGDWQLRTDAYLKRLSGVPTAAPLATSVDRALLLHPDSMASGRLGVEGIELSAAGHLGLTTLSVGYRWQRERRTLGELSFTPRTSRPHRIVALASRPFGEREAAISVTWTSGLRTTPSRFTIPSLGGVGADGRLHPPAEPGITPNGQPYGWPRAAVLGEPNSASLPSYLRVDLDLRGAWDWTLFGRRGVLEPYVSVLNLFGNENVLVAEEAASDRGIRRTFAPQFPMLPTFGLRWRF